MRPRLAFAYVILVTTPIAALIWLGLRLVAAQNAEITERFDVVVTARLDQSANAVSRVVDGLEGELLAATGALPVEHAALRAYLRTHATVAHVLVFDGEGQLTFPPIEGPLSESERALLERTRGLWQTRDFARGVTEGDDGAGTQLTGWHLWYWGGGLNLMYRRRLDDGRTIAVEVGRPRLLAAVLSALPTTEPEAAASEGGERIALVDSSGRTLYQWGTFDPPTDWPSRLDRPLDAPLESWRLTWVGAPPPAASNMGVYGGLGAAGLVLLLLSAYVYRASTAEMRRAARRITFVNQVSHELKTPLTNIRMYAELLDDDLFDADDRTRRRLGIIVDESQRLSRLIGNILTFARHQRDQLALRPGSGCVDEVVEAVIDRFTPALEGRGIEISTALDAPEQVELDGDAVGQILGNLLGNVEKYAADGKAVSVQTEQRDGQTWLTVTDRGPGIPRKARERIFEPFFRVSNALSDGVAGTGIGLGIARTLARLHGGDLTLEPSEQGARFVAQLRTPPAEEERS